MRRHCRRVPALRSSFAGFRFPLEVIVIAVRWYLRYSLSYRDIEELLAERGLTVDQLTARSYTTGYEQRAASDAGQGSG
jgi:IS6 family transposase